MRDALVESSRPRVSRMGKGRSLRCAVLMAVLTNARDQLVAMCVYIWTSDSLCSTRQRKVLALDDVVSDLQEGTGPVDCGGWLVDVCDALTDHASEFIEELHDKIIDLKIIFDQQTTARFLALLRKQQLLCVAIWRRSATRLAPGLRA